MPHGTARDGAGIRLVIAIILNGTITVAQIIGGIISGSLALLSDALHNLSDTASLGITYGARRVARRDATQRKTFGYRRIEIIAAFVNLITLVIIALYLVKEAVERFMNPQPIDGTIMMVVAVIGLIGDFISAAMLYKDSKGSLNIRSAFLHTFSDGVSSVAVVGGGYLVLTYGMYWVDPLLTIGISIYLLIHSYHMLRQTVDILMESTPRDIDLLDLRNGVRRLDGIIDIHHVHAWQLDEVQRALEAHIVIDEEDLPRMEAIKARIKEYLLDVHRIGHSTLEFESVPCEELGGTDCYEPAGPAVIGRGA